MRILSRVCAVLSWVLFVIGVLVQGLLILTLWMPPFLSNELGKQRVENVVNERALPFVIVGTVLFAAGFLLFCFLRRGRWGWYAAMVAGALVLAGVGLYLKVSYPETIVSEGVYAGYNSAFKLVWRHMLPIAVAVLELLVGLFKSRAEDKELREEALREIKEKGIKPRFDQ